VASMLTTRPAKPYFFN